MKGEEMSYAARCLRRGDTYDYEDARVSHRLRLAHGILADHGITWKTSHGNTAINEKVEFGWPKHACADNCVTVIVEPWVTDEILNAAYRFADLLQNERGAWNRSQAFKAKQMANKSEILRNYDAARDAGLGDD